MVICLDARTVQTHFPGVGRYTANLARALAPLLESHEELVLLRERNRPSLWDIETLAGPRIRVVDVSTSPFSLAQQWVLPRVIRQIGATVYHSPYYLMPYRPGAPAVLTVHDLIPLRYPQYFMPMQRAVFNATMRLAVRSAAAIIAVSHTTADDLCRGLGVGADRVTVIPEAADPGLDGAPAAAPPPDLRLPASYVLYVGSNKPHKNLVRLVEAWARMTTHSTALVIAGVWDTRYGEAQQRAREFGCASIHFLGPVAETDLRALYQNATLFVFPSEHEGFGLPVLEAMACGVPVACADTPSLHEVAGDAATFFDPADADAITHVLTTLLNDPDRRAALKRRSVARAAEFSWERAGKLTLTVYRRLAHATDHEPSA